ncbi:MAG: 50S ribosomal protein L39e [Candidatus Micrarchaeota archaeon]|nr:50S ribosomal protein L39e [Candidatus Micrarchaeota archaeon]MDE1804874.1 50S ribosomal protein L39e [Candidatus Micrarchaeota archaeon]MDE1847164.1 50S ribosomal protein L39e [Candidatus Micrarchaeota archaeon]
MSKKTMKQKMSLGRSLKRNRRIPSLVMMRTHRKVQQNKFQREWRHRKLRTAK